MQNTSHAVMAQRNEPSDSLDNFPTPPWATRALVEHVIGGRRANEHLVCLEPACGQGHMAEPLKEYFSEVDSSDVADYGYGKISDFLAKGAVRKKYDWVVTNPPFRLAEDFVLRALEVANVGVAILARTVFLESKSRYEAIFSVRRPTKVAQFVERVPMVKGRLDRKASTATGYAWLVWEKAPCTSTELVWIPPCRKNLERDSDYLPIGYGKFLINRESQNNFQHTLFEDLVA